MPARIRSKSLPGIARWGSAETQFLPALLVTFVAVDKSDPSETRSRARWREIAPAPAAAGTGEFCAAARRHLIRPLRGHLPLKGKANGGVSSGGRLDAAAGRRTRDPSSVSFADTCLPAGRSVRGSDTPPVCHSTLRTHQGGMLGGAAVGAKNAYRGWGKRQRQPPRR